MGDESESIRFPSRIALRLEVAVPVDQFGVEHAEPLAQRLFHHLRIRAMCQAAIACTVVADESTGGDVVRCRRREALAGPPSPDWESNPPL